MKELNLKLSIEDTNTILAALGKMPYAQVYGIIAKINEQATPSLGTAKTAWQGLTPSKEIPKPQR